MLIKGKEVQEGPKQLPANPRLWNMVTTQAKTRFSKQSPASAHWVHTRYVQMGGKFVDSQKDIDPKNRDLGQEKTDKIEASKKKKVTKSVKKSVTKAVNKPVTRPIVK
jgi:hypothetical protein